MIEVKRYNLRQNIPATATTLLPDVVVSASDYTRLEQECERLRAIIDSALEQFPFNADRQKFTFNGQEVTADGDDLFYSVKRVNAFLCEVHNILSAKP